MPAPRRPYRTSGMREGHPGPPAPAYKPLNPGAAHIEGARETQRLKNARAGAVARAGGSATLTPIQRKTERTLMNAPYQGIPFSRRVPPKLTGTRVLRARP